MKNFKNLLVIAVILGSFIATPIYSFIKEAHGIMVIVSDYAIRGQRHVLPEAGINAQDLVNKGIYPIKISVTNKSNELVTISADSIGLIQENNDVIKTKLNKFSGRHIISIIAGIFVTNLALFNLKNALVTNNANPNKKFDGVVSGVLYGATGAACFAYTWYDSKQISEKLVKSLEEVSIKGSIHLQPGASIDKFVFISQDVYNQINTCNIILKKGVEAIAFQMPLD